MIKNMINDGIDENNKRDTEVSEITKMEDENRRFTEEIDKLEKERKEHEQKKREDLERIRNDRKKKEKPEEEIKMVKKMINGHLTLVKKKDYDHKLKVFRHDRLGDFSGSGEKKMEKVLRKVHGVSLKKKIDFLRAIKAYNPSKSVLKKGDFDDFAKRFKSKRFTGSKFQKAVESGVDIKELRKSFGKRDIDRLKRGVTGQNDPHQYKSRSSDLRNTPSSSAGRINHSL